ncbi:DNA-binding protein smubp-2 [Culex quinquefasciatus]|uniref:DNA-binding protein smubp-2 n=1 Tax=Culex quinquefasciatus TaxID=7176 RepID=B0X8H5_CULQU|nr:DNA-binding protein smubp-2 [Culex quinquefasciatus]|eukprot:XP_001865947.1 DNA-binding protein smubp-2 [Culex quinquefasciatus]
MPAMEVTSNKFMQQRFDRQKHEIESFVVRIYRHNLIKDGGIIKRKLREKLFEEIKLRRITRVKMDELGWVLMNHDLINRNKGTEVGKEGEQNPAPSLFLFNMERLRDLLESHEQRNHAELTAKRKDKQTLAQEVALHNDKALQELRDMVEAKRPLATIRHVTTIERMLKQSFPPSSRNCFVCREFFKTPDQYSKHFEDVHGEVFRISNDDERFSTGQKLDVVQHYDALSPVTLFEIRNNHHVAMQVDGVYLYHTTQQLMPVMRDVWPITINTGDSFKFSITTGMFLVAEHDYSILVHFNRVLEYVEQYHFRVLKEPVELRVKDNPIALKKLEEYPPPPEMVAVFKNGFKMVDSYTVKERKMCEDIRSFMDADPETRLNAANYVQILQLMNNVEDYNVQFELSQYDMKDVHLAACGAKRFYSLRLNQFSTVPRSLVEGDYIELSYTRPNKSLKTVIGVISQICSNKVLFETEEPLKYDVRWHMKFNPNRTPIRMEYQALEIVKRHGLSGFFFPTVRVCKVATIGRESFTWFNPNVASNVEQQTAIVSIVNETARPYPYVLFGPPGTVFNLNTGCYRLPSKEELYGKRIVISTLTSSGKLVQANIRPGHFSYVFIDECGSATEASALVPIAGIISSPGKIDGSIVLSGDPKQLGPVTRSEFAADMGLKRSMLERLMNLPVYQKSKLTNQYNNALITKLLQNYRSHEAILHFSNKTFYQNELKPCAAECHTHWALNWPELPAKSFPIIFESTMGKLAREQDSASYFNQKEIELVEFYLRKLFTDGVNDRPVTQLDIGIVSPYKKQCIKLKQMTARHGWNAVEVGSVEAFQGREKPVIILTTVRSGTRGVGFLDNVKRLNVALTRAKALLVVIGNPETLQKDANWYEFIRYCYGAGAIRGVKFELDEKQHKVQEIEAEGGGGGGKDDNWVQVQQRMDALIRKISDVKI